MKYTTKDEVGNVYTRLTVIERHGAINNKATWVCQCECGESIIAVGAYLRNGEVQSCGCLKKDKSRKQFGESNFNRLCRQYKKDAQRRNLLFDLSDIEIREITSTNCFYCGRCPSQKKTDKNSYGDYIYNGIDRVDNSQGYILSNCVPCCGDCNRAKRTMSIQEFKDFIYNIYTHWINPS